MKRIFLFLTVLFLSSTIVYFNSCKKTDAHNVADEVLSKKINTWLDSQKSPAQPNKAKNIDLLRENLDFKNLRYEQLNKDEQFLILPVKDVFKNLKNIDNNTILNLLLVLDKSGNIIRGNVVLFIPTTVTLDKVPGNTFHKMYNYQSLDCSGTFKFLSVTGKSLFQYEYKYGELHSFGAVQPKMPAGTSNNGRITSECWNWFLYVYFWINGVLVGETQTFLGTTCEDDGTNCDDPMYQTLCPDAGAGGGASNPVDPSCCITDPNAQLSSSSVAETIGKNCGMVTIDPVTGKESKTCAYNWYFNINNLLWFTWKYSSIEQYILEKVGDTWKFKSGGVAHLGMGSSGSIAPCISFNCSINAATPSISNDRSMARMDLIYTTTFNISCCPTCSPTMETANAGDFWYAQ